MDLIRDFRLRGTDINYIWANGQVEMTTLPHTDLWQRTYYRFRNDNAPMLLRTSSEKYFSFSVKTVFDSRHRFDQCGVVIYLDSDNWVKASSEYQDARIQHLGSVVTNLGYSDWATSELAADVKTIWYRLSRRENDFRIESSFDGRCYAQMRVCHLWNANDKIDFGVYACSPEESSFRAVFSEFELTDCLWPAHDGQPPDME